MAKKTFFAILVTEATIENKVADLGIVICDREGHLHNQCAVLIDDNYNHLEIFCDENLNGALRVACLERRRTNYEEMINARVRIVSNVNTINSWINQVIDKYDPILTAYDLDINSTRCQNTGIDVSNFSERFCFRDAIIDNIRDTEKYIKFAAKNNLADRSGEWFCMDFKEAMENIYWFLFGRRKIISNTALEDARDFQIPILASILKKRDWKRRMIDGK